MTCGKRTSLPPPCLTLKCSIGRSLHFVSYPLKRKAPSLLPLPSKRPHVLISHFPFLLPLPGQRGRQSPPPSISRFKEFSPKCPTRKISQVSLNSEVWKKTVDANSTQQRQCYLYIYGDEFEHLLFKGGAVGTEDTSYQSSTPTQSKVTVHIHSYSLKCGLHCTFTHTTPNVWSPKGTCHPTMQIW